MRGNASPVRCWEDENDQAYDAWSRRQQEQRDNADRESAASAAEDLGLSTDLVEEIRRSN